MRTYGPLSEHICLTFELSFLVQHFQRAKQAIAGILTECKTVSTAGQQAIFCCIGIIQTIQLSLLFLNFLIRVALCLILNQSAHAFPKRDHTANTIFSSDRHFHWVHTGVFPVVHLAIYKAIAEIAHRRVCRYREIFLIRLL